MENLIEVADGIVETTTYDERDDKLIVKTTYDSSSVIEANKEAQATAGSFGRYSGNLTHVGRIHMGDVARLKNLGYDILSPDPTEVRRALCYIQSHEPQLLTVPGKPFAMVRPKWR